MASTPLLYDVKVFDDRTGHVLGHLVSINEDGIEMLSDQAIDSTGENYFSIENILDIEPGKKALFTAICDACKADDEVIDLYHVHLLFTHTSASVDELAHQMH